MEHQPDLGWITDPYGTTTARHLSFIESGRSQPSPEMVLRLARALDVPIRERNQLLLAAGYAPLYRETGLDSAQAAQVRGAQPHARRSRALPRRRVVPVPGNDYEKRAGRLGGHSTWRLADSQHGSDQVVQRPGQVLLGDQDNLVIDAKMLDRPSRNRAVVRRQGCQCPCEEFLPRASVAGRGSVNHPAPHGAVRTDQGHDDPHQVSLSLPGTFRQADHHDGGLWARPAGHTPC